MSEGSKKVNLQATVNVDSIQIRKDNYFQNAFIIDLPLEKTPDHVWQHLFEQEWRLSRHLWDRKLFVVGEKLRLLTTPTDIEDKLDWVKQVIQRTNLAVDERDRELQAEGPISDKNKGQPLLEEEKAEVDAIKEILRRKFG